MDASYRFQQILCAVCVFCIAVLLSFQLIPGMLARYASDSAPSGDGGRVAKFNVRIEPVTPKKHINLQLTDNETYGDLSDSYNFLVYNDSEVAISYKVILHFEQPFPNEGLFISASGFNNQSTLSEDRKSVTFSGASLQPNTNREHKVTFTAHLGSEGEVLNQNFSSGVTLQIIVEQMG